MTDSLHYEESEDGELYHKYSQWPAFHLLCRGIQFWDPSQIQVGVSSQHHSRKWVHLSQHNQFLQVEL